MSVVIITKNEERNIERCLKSVAFAAEKLVVDSGSQDRTGEVARKLGAKVLDRPWLGFGPQKRAAANEAQHDWILALDADEELSPELQEEIQQKFRTLDPNLVYYFPRRSFHLGRWIMHGGWYPDRQPRLFHRKHFNWNEAEIHETVPGPRSELFEKNLNHFVFRDLSHQVLTNDRYSSLQAKDHVAKGKSFSYLKAVTKPWVKFVECYFIKRGFLDGYPGFVIAVGAAYSVFIRWAKIWEQERLGTRDE